MTDNGNGSKKEVDQEVIRGASHRAAIHTAYFYYLRYAANGTYSLTAYEYFDIAQPLSNIADVAQQMVENANGTNLDPRPYGTDFDSLFRRRKGYFIVALEGASFNSNDPINFSCDGATYPSSKGNLGRHAFVPLGRHDVALPGNEIISVAAYLYRAKSYHRGVELDHAEWEHFSIEFDAIIQAQLVRALFEDSGGTNMGPPPPPPGRLHRRRSA